MFLLEFLVVVENKSLYLDWHGSFLNWTTANRDKTERNIFKTSLKKIKTLKLRKHNIIKKYDYKER